MTEKESTLEKLNSFIHVLEQHAIVKSSTPIYELITSLNRTREERGLIYRLNNLDFHGVSKEQFIQEDKWETSDLSIQLSLNIALKEHGSFKFGDVKESVVEIIYETMSEDTCELARGAWHLDYHEDKPGDKPPDYIHPNYHFHHGGKRIKDSIDNYGNLVVLDAPRLVHPPLDFFLAVDFLATNFLEKRIWRNLRADTEYKNIISDSQESWWKEYYQQLAGYWSAQTSGAEDVAKRDLAKLANPHLI